MGKTKIHSLLHKSGVKSSPVLENIRTYGVGRGLNCTAVFGLNTCVEEARARQRQLAVFKVKTVNHTVLGVNPSYNTRMCVCAYHPGLHTHTHTCAR